MSLHQHDYNENRDSIEKQDTYVDQSYKKQYEQNSDLYQTTVQVVFQDNKDEKKANNNPAEKEFFEDKIFKNQQLDGQKSQSSSQKSHQRAQQNTEQQQSKEFSDMDNESNQSDDSGMEDEDGRKQSQDNKNSSGNGGYDWRVNPRKKWGQGTIQQCKHKNIFKNFGNIIIKYFKESEEFKRETTEIFGNFEKLAFHDWIFKEIKLESKKDFIKGWVEQSDDDEQIWFFKRTLRKLSHGFLTKKGVEFLKKSRMKHKEIHLRSLNPLIECAVRPHNLKQFKPDETNMEFEASKLRSDY